MLDEIKEKSAPITLEQAEKLGCAFHIKLFIRIRSIEIASESGCYLSDETLAKEFEKDINYVKKELSKLRKLGLIFTEKKKVRPTDRVKQRFISTFKKLKHGEVKKKVTNPVTKKVTESVTFDEKVTNPVTKKVTESVTLSEKKLPNKELLSYQCGNFLDDQSIYRSIKSREEEEDHLTDQNKQIPKLSLITTQQQLPLPQPKSELRLLIDEFLNDDPDPSGRHTLIAYPDHRLTPQQLQQAHRSYAEANLSLHEGLIWAVEKILSKPKNKSMSLSQALLHARSETLTAKENLASIKHQQKKKNQLDESVSHMQQRARMPKREVQATKKEQAINAINLNTLSEQKRTELRKQSEKQLQNVRHLFSDSKYEDAVVYGMKEIFYEEKTK